MNKKIIIKKPSVIEIGDVVRATCDIKVVNGEKCDNKEVWYEIGKQWKGGLCTDLCDAYVVGLFHYCLSQGYDIESELPISETLYHNLNDILMPALVKNEDCFKNIELTLTTKSDREIPYGSAVGTGVSCGVDSMHAIWHYHNHKNTSFKLTHLLISNVGSYSEIYGNKDSRENVRKKAFLRAKRVASNLKLPLIEANSNFYDVFIQDHLFTHSFANAFSVLMMRYFWSKYYYASSGYDYSHFSVKNAKTNDCSDYDILALSCFSTPGVSFYSEGSDCTRVQKIKDISEYDIAKTYLYSCIKKEYNCGVCGKCLRNLWTFDVLGISDNFKKSYNIGQYFENHKRNLIMLINSHDGFTDELNGLFKKSGNQEYADCVKINEEIKLAIENYNKNNNVSEQYAIFEKYHSISDRCTYYCALSKYRGKGTTKDLKTSITLLRSIPKYGDAAILLIDILSKSTSVADKKEAYEIASRYCEINPALKYKLSIMLLEGAGVESNILLSEKIFKDSLVANNRIQAFVKYIFELRRIIRITSDAIQKDKLLSLYYRLLEEHGSWIGFETKFEDIPKFPHGIINIFISDRAKIGKNCTIFQKNDNTSVELDASAGELIIEE